MRTQREHRERGDATVEAVLAVPVLLFLIMTVFQFGLWYHASHVARAAAQEGVRAARVEGGDAAAGQVRAQRFMHDAAPTLVHGVEVTSSRDANTARVEVHGVVRSLIPGFDLEVDANAQSPVERFRSDTP
jgi:Flp pilus assembly protein TadG